MNVIGLYLGAVGLFCLSAILIRHTDPRTTSGGADYEMRQKRKLIGNVVIVVGIFFFGLAVLTQFFSDNLPAPHSPPISSVAGQPRIASVTPPPRPPSQPSANASASYSHPIGRPSQPPQVDPAILLLRQGFQLLQQKQLDAALSKANAALQSAPQNPNAYALRGSIYAEKKLWSQAEKDYQSALQINDKNVQMRFDLAELEFMQKKYDAARPGFINLKQDPDVGDLATFKAFLCDLFGAHEEAAAKELDVFNQAGANASYYFGNASWSLVHHKTEDARGWLMSAANIYTPDKFKLYAASLIDLGYMPLPPTQ
jgi:hypothetical protein